MNYIAIIMLTVSLWPSVCAAQSEADKEAIIQTFDSWNTGWAEADAALAVQDYAEDTDRNEYTDVEFLSPEIAIVRSKLVHSGQKMSTGDVMPDRHINHLRVYQKRDGRWLIVSHLISQVKEKR